MGSGYPVLSPLHPVPFSTAPMKPRKLGLRSKILEAFSLLAISSETLAV